MTTHDTTYNTMLQHILDNGRVRPDRTGTGTLGVFGYQNRYNMADGFPLLTTKKVNFHAIVVELLWFLRGDTNIRYLVQNDVHIWTDWPLKHYNAVQAGFGKEPVERAQFEAMIAHDADFATEWGDCGPIYGAQWRRRTGKVAAVKPEFTHTTEHKVHGHVDLEYTSIDQIQNVLNELGSNPFGRRHIVDAWNVSDIPDMVVSGLPPCHCLFQFNVRAMTEDERWAYATLHKPKHIQFDTRDTWQDVARKLDQFEVPKYFLDLQLYQRSADVFLGVPFNIASYALLLHIFAQQLGYVPGEFVHTFGDLHIYANHMDQVRQQVARTPGAAPTVQITARASLDEYTVEDFTLQNYNPQPAITAPIAV